MKSRYIASYLAGKRVDELAPILVEIDGELSRRFIRPNIHLIPSLESDVMERERLRFFALAFCNIDVF